MEQQKMLRENYAGAASNNNMSNMQYGIGKPGLAKYTQIQNNPNENKKNNNVKKNKKNEIARIYEYEQ